MFLVQEQLFVVPMFLGDFLFSKVSLFFFHISEWLLLDFGASLVCIYRNMGTIIGVMDTKLLQAKLF